ncbi:hypothetical protein DL93DRAFT_2170353 [Clavulina sp. PMI_390]|nr:hypothetical protein DL93DRAFT_2170353 [Clavulina sp. PMI_390]
MLSTKIETARKSNLNNPAVSLHPELLGDIFIIAVESQIPEPNMYLPPTTMSLVRRTRSVICEVCHIWRMTAIQTKRIWAIIDLPHGITAALTNSYHSAPKRNTSALGSGTDDWDDDDELPARPKIPPQSLDLTGERLERLGNAPLSLYLYSKDAAGKRMLLSSSIFREISHSTQRLLHRCRHLQFDNEYIDVPRFLETSHPLPELYSLFGTVWQDLFPPSVLDLTAAPQLRDLWLCAFESMPGSTQPLLKLKLGADLLLTRLELSGSIDYDSIISLLENCPRLEELRWASTTSPSVPASLTPTLSPMPPLRHVTLRGTALSIASSLRASLLVRLEIHYPDEGPHRPIWDSRMPPLSDPLQFPMLRVLILKGAASTALAQEVNITRFAEAHPKLEVLAIPMHVTERMSTVLASIPALQHVRAIRQVGDDSGAVSLTHTWMQREQAAALDASRPSSSSHSHPVLYLIRGVGRFNERDTNNDFDLIKDFVVFNDWKFDLWRAADWDRFLQSQSPA